MPKKIPDADRELFEQAMRDVRPLKPRNQRAPEATRARQPKRVTAARAAPPPALTLDDVQGLHADDELHFARNGVQPKLLRDLRRGRVAIDATLDLHGLTAAGAQDALQQFLEHCTARGHRTLRIVHGKGRGAHGTPAVLKSVVNRWLRERADVLAFVSAPRHDGGTGALYVLLRRAAR